jgi:hypothetical protein
MNLRERIAGIDASVDDVQSVMEAASRAADALQTDISKFDGHLGAPLLRSVLQHVKDLQLCARDQRAAMQELRNAVARLRQGLKLAKRNAIRPPPLTSAGSQQSR